MIYFAAVLVAIPLIALLILKSPSVQTYLTKRIADYLSFELNTVVKVGGVDVKLFKSIVLEDVYIEDQHHNELLKIGKLEANIKRIQSKKKIITFNNIKLNTLHFYLKYYHGEKETNLQFLINYFSSNDTTPSKSSWKVKCNSLYLKNTAFSYNDYTVKPSPVGIDYSNMKLTNININIKNIRTSGDTISGRIEKLSLKEKSGFIINNLSMNVRICSHYLSARNLIIKTPNTDANLNLLFSYNGYRSYQDFLKKIHISSEVKQSVVDMNDIAYFAPLLKGIDNKVLISCHYYNNNETMIAQNLELYTEQATHISGDFKVSNVTDVNKLYIQAGFKEFTTTKKDIENFHLPIVAGLKHIIIPSQVYSLGFINIKGDYSGYVNKFKANMTMTSDIGNITSDISFDYNLKTKIPSYSGKIISDKFDAGKILNYKNLGKVSMNAYLSGKYFDFNRLNMKLNGSISSVIYNGYNYKNINVNGDISKKNFTGSVKINEPNLIVDFNGDVNFNKKLPTFEFTTNIANANLSRIKLLNRDSTSNLSTLIEVNLQGNNPDNFTGEVDVSNTIYKEKGKIYKLDKFILSSEASKTERKIHLFSDFADATVQGNFQFGELINSLKSFVTRYLPSLTFKDNSTIAEIKPTKKGKKLIEKKVASPQILKYNFQFKNTSDITALFIPQLKISPNTDVAGVYNSSKNDFSLIAEASKIEFNGKTLNNWFFNSKVENNHLQLNIGCKRFSFTDSLYFDNFNILSTAAKDTLNFNCLWNSNKFRVNNRGIINGNISFKNKPELVLNLNKSTVIILDSVWNIAESRILIDSSAFMIKRLVINKKNQELNINGVISENPLSELYIDFNNFELNNFNKFLEKSGYSFEGVLNGTTNISGLYGNINFISDIKIKDFIMNNEKLGELSLLSSWDNVRNALKIKAGVTRGTIETVGIDGYYYPSSKTNNFDFNINVDKFKLYLLQQYMKSFCSNFHGFATGKLKLYGTTGEPILEGKLDLQKSGLKIDYLNTSYTFAHEVLLGRNFISFKNMVLNDTLGNEAIASGKISHNYFSDFKYEININAKKFSCLNTNSNQNSIYYGSGFITGKVNIKGNSENVYIDVNARTEKGTRVFIPLTSSEELSETNYISFIRKDSSKIVTKEKAKIDLSGIQMNFDLEVTPSTEAQIIFDKKVGDVIKVKGNGNLKFEINTLGNFNMYGDYTIEEGDYLFTLKNLINKRFKIEKGGTIKWNGSPYDANVNMNAIYTARTSIADLVIGGDTGKYKQIVPVQCILTLKEKLLKPAISFDIKIPDADENIQRSLKNITSSEQETNNQVFYLLLANRFKPIGNQNNMFNSGIGGLGTTSTELLSNQLNNWLSQISTDFNIGVNYRTGDKLNPTQLEVALSTQLFNNRVLIDGNVGIGNQKTSNLVGDFTVEYKLTQEGKFRVKAFNKTNNNNEYLNINANQYTQGLGISYRKEFDSLGDFFRKIKKNK